MNKHPENQIQTKQMKMMVDAEIAFNSAYDLVNKTYLNFIEDMEIVPLKEMEIETRNSTNFRLLEISKIVYDNRKSSIESLLNVLNSLHPHYTVALIIQTKDSATRFYLGIRSSSQAKPASSGIKLLRKALGGNFPGSDHKNITNSEIESILDMREFRKINHQWAIGSTSFIPSLKNDDHEQFAQGLERFIDAMGEEDYTAMILAEPLNFNQLASLQKGYESMATTLTLYQKTSMSVGTNQSQALSESLTQGVTETLSQSMTMSQSYTDGTSTTESGTYGKSSNRAGIWMGLGAALGGFIGGPAGAMILGGVGSAISGLFGEKNESHSKSISTNESRTRSDSKQTGQSRSESTSETIGQTSTLGSSETINIEQHNISINRLIEKIDQQLKRSDEAKSYGIWNTSFYVLSDSTESAHTACSLFKGVLKGNESTIEDSAITVWNQSNNRNRNRSLEYFENVLHPRLLMTGREEQNRVMVTPASLVSGRELSLLMNFPRRSVSGLAVLEMPEFGRDVVYQSDKPKSEDTLVLGKVYRYGQTLENTEIPISLDSLKMHTFIAGSTGSGKTNTVCKIIEKAREKGVKFLIIEPAKGEYKDYFGGHPDVKVFGTNPSYAPLLKINPFEFPENIHVLEHIDRLVEIFNACWPMYAAMPAVLKNGIEDIYRLHGWDLEYSKCSFDEPVFPTISDLSEMLPIIIQRSLYSADMKSDYSGALVTRVNSLNSGLSGLIFSDQIISNETLFNSNCIIDLSRIGSSETKALLMGIMFLKLHEYRQSQNQFHAELKHLTVLEEAHHLLRKSSTEQAQESSNLQGKSLEMITNAIAEMRAYGEGFIIADQAPGLLDQAVIRNTNTKIIMKLTEDTDRKIIGKSAFMNDDQINEIPRFPTGVAAVYQNNWMIPVLCKVDLFEDKKTFNYMYDNEADYKHSKEMKSMLLNVIAGLVEKIDMENYTESEYRDLIEYLKSSRLKAKKDLIRCMEYLIEGDSDSLVRFSVDPLKLSNLISDVIDNKAILAGVDLQVKHPDYVNWTNSIIEALKSNYDIKNETRQLKLAELILEQIDHEFDSESKWRRDWSNYIENKIEQKVRKR